MGLPKTLGQRVAERRGALGWTQQQLADEMGTDQAFVSRMESDKYEPGMRVLVSLAKALGVSLSTLLEGVGPNKAQR
jgi:transcriptional regulator with XRE-family HTH domain